MDMELCQLDKIYVHNLVNYNKVLLQRNKLLKDIAFNPSLADTLDVWDEQLVGYGLELIKIRQRFVENLNGIIYDINKTKIIFVSALNKNVTSLKIEDTVQELIGTQLFVNCSNLQEVILPSSLKVFIGNVFEGMWNISKISIPSSNTNFKVEDNMLLSKDGIKLYYATSGRSTLNIPNTVKEICMASIQGFKISEIRFGGNVEKIDEQFGKNLQGLTKIYIGTNVKDINANFKDYTGIPNSLSFEIDSGNLIYKVLNNCILTKDGKSLLTYVNAKSEIVIPEGVETIYNLSWSNSITKVKLPNTLKRIDRIRGIDIESIDIPSSIETISETAFFGCSKLSNINIDKKQLKVDTDEKRVVFRNKEMREFTVEDSINLLKTVRVDFDISFDKYDIEYTKISNTYNASPKEIEFLQKMCNAQTQKNLMTEELIKEAEERYEWIKL
mgnify:CR=1 FL=1